jgi:hypothetical protein
VVRRISGSWFAVAAVVLIAIACQSAPPSSPTPIPTSSVAATESPGKGSPGTAELARGCWGIREPDCGRTVGAAFDALAEFESHPYGYATVRFTDCPESGCQDALTLGWPIHVLLEPTDRSAMIEAVVRSEGGSLVAEVNETRAFFGVEARSGPAPLGEPFRLELGHCGISSGIDADGSFWDPIGQIDPQNPDTINAAPGTMLITTDTTATFQTARLHLELVRHHGLKYLPACA